MFFLQHVVFGICRLIDILVPDIPESLELKIKRERYLAKQALQDSESIMKVISYLPAHFVSAFCFSLLSPSSDVRAYINSSC